MTETLQAAILHLCETFRPLNEVAIGYQNLDAAEIAKEFKRAKPDTAEHLALQALATVNPLKAAPVADSTVKQ